MGQLGHQGICRRTRGYGKLTSLGRWQFLTKTLADCSYHYFIWPSHPVSGTEHPPLLLCRSEDPFFGDGAPHLCHNFPKPPVILSVLLRLLQRVCTRSISRSSHETPPLATGCHSEGFSIAIRNIC
jgi:hypothetical protein